MANCRDPELDNLIKQWSTDHDKRSLTSIETAISGARSQNLTCSQPGDGISSFGTISKRSNVNSGDTEQDARLKQVFQTLRSRMESYDPERQLGMALWICIEVGIPSDVLAGFLAGDVDVQHIQMPNCNPVEQVSIGLPSILSSRGLWGRQKKQPARHLRERRFGRLKHNEDYPMPSCVDR